jgi:hypothetical protein
VWIDEAFTAKTTAVVVKARSDASSPSPRWGADTYPPNC